MPKLIKNDTVSSDSWQRALPDSDQLAKDNFPTLAQWQAAAETLPTVQLQPGDEVATLVEALDTLAIIAVDFPVFTDGRGFSYARELRQRGYRGELRATGEFMPDQVHYLRRCGFDAFQPADASRIEEYLRQLRVFSEHYQASIDEPLPLFRRRDSESQPA